MWWQKKSLSFIEFYMNSWRWRFHNISLIFSVFFNTAFLKSLFFLFSSFLIWILVEEKFPEIFKCSSLSAQLFNKKKIPEKEANKLFVEEINERFLSSLNFNIKTKPMIVVGQSQKNTKFFSYLFSYCNFNINGRKKDLFIWDSLFIKHDKVL